MRLRICLRITTLNLNHLALSIIGSVVDAKNINCGLKCLDETKNWIITESDPDYSVKRIKPPSQYDDEETVEIPIQ